ncbi:bifunctional hydroxymethylpyrimidine kinase/phosphomethylpyrimidine kinase [Shewanella sp. ULN5]|uniref:bifunctional hydroxymethylpyrimidine kinase/phosphomethylpyrimidine kinase n=1 Tax=Shewanella sp. ULN5 TaxID=2994678 RepID=UPI00273DDC26|nr:bifunctional hydroxymethylpyrimidine kinase/phosphomethylpyrimidine kinase [Shewanella sp. ULN5]MDP5145374.1 bifunctional hydroxymethylpyrimidine kinase/phosphomethylpyrimidine kinase [Shewanella sp. ULN5]
MSATDMLLPLSAAETPSRQQKSVNKIVWSIAGSDSGGGAGIQADLATIQDLNCHACTVITTLTAQNSVNVNLVEAVSEAMLFAQLDSLLSDMPPDAIKIGLIANQQQVNQLAQWLSASIVKANRYVPIILDPVMVASSGNLLNQHVVDFSPLRGVVSVITPNQSELIALARAFKSDARNQASSQAGNHAEVNHQADPQINVKDVFTSITPNTTSSNEALTLAKMVLMAQQVSRYLGCHVVAKGGDAAWQADRAMDVYVCQHVEGGSAEHNDSVFVLSSQRVDTANNHGSGCTLSSAMACFLAQDFVLHDAVVLAKAYVTSGLIQSIKVASGPGYLARTGWPTSLELMPHIVPLIVRDSANRLLNDASIEQQISQSIRQKKQYQFSKLSTPLEVYPVVANISMLEMLLGAGCKTLQLRLKPEISCCDKGIAFEDEQQKAQWIEQQVFNAIQLSRKFNAQLFINDHWQLALKYGAFGVHLGQEDALSADLAALAENNIALGLSSHSYFEILLATQVNPSYIALGHIFATTTKNMPSTPQGLTKLAKYTSLLKHHFPTVAIGGIDSQNLKDIAVTGVDDVAVVRAITQAREPVEAYKSLNKQWQTLKSLSVIADSKGLNNSTISTEPYQEAL